MLCLSLLPRMISEDLFQKNGSSNFLKGFIFYSMIPFCEGHPGEGKH